MTHDAFAKKPIEKLQAEKSCKLNTSLSQSRSSLAKSIFEACKLEISVLQACCKRATSLLQDC